MIYVYFRGLHSLAIGVFCNGLMDTTKPEDYCHVRIPYALPLFVHPCVWPLCHVQPYEGELICSPFDYVTRVVTLVVSLPTSFMVQPSQGMANCYPLRLIPLSRLSLTCFLLFDCVTNVVTFVVHFVPRGIDYDTQRHQIS